MPPFAVARRGLARALDGYLLRGAEQISLARTGPQQAAIARYCDAATSRMKAADTLLEPSEALGALLLYRDAAVLLLAAMAKASDAGADLCTKPSEAWSILDGVATPPHRPEGFDQARATLAQDDVLAIDALSPADRFALRKAAQDAVRWLALGVDPRPVRVLRTVRKVRVGVAAALLFGVLFWALLWRPNIALGKPASASSLLRGSPPAGGVTNGQMESTFGVQTTVEDQPWVMVDLGKPYALGEVRVYNRADGWLDDGLPFVIELSIDGVTWTTIDRRTTSFSESQPWKAKAHGTLGRYVRVRCPHHGYIAIDEIKVYQ
jgi:hypothetical protein